MARLNVALVTFNVTTSPDAASVASVASVASAAGAASSVASAAGAASSVVAGASEPPQPAKRLRDIAATKIEEKIFLVVFLFI